MSQMSAANKPRDPFLKELSQNILDTLDEETLRVICDSLGIPYGQLTGQKRAQKVNDLVSRLRDSRQIHELVAMQPRLAPTGSAEKGWQLFVTLWKRTGRRFRLSRKRREEQRVVDLAERKALLRGFFNNCPLAFEEDLCRNWEFQATRTLHRFVPGAVTMRITSLSKDVATLDFLTKSDPSPAHPPASQADQCVQESPQPDKDLPAPNPSSPLLAPSFLAFHSVKLWYRFLRSRAQLALFPLGIVIVALLLTIVSSLFYLAHLFATGTAEEDLPTIVYTASGPGEYYIQVKDNALEDRPYLFGVTETSNEIAQPDFSKKNIWPLFSGQEVFAQIASSQQHLYSIEGRVNEVIWVWVYSWYSDPNLRFRLLDPAMDECDSISFPQSPFNTGGLSAVCRVTFPGSYYIQIEMSDSSLDPPLGAFPRYGFIVRRVSPLYAPSNHSPEVSQVITPGLFVYSTMSPLEDDWYRFSITTAQRLEISGLGLSNMPDSSLTMFVANGDKLDRIAVSSRSQSRVARARGNIFEAAGGRAAFLAVLLNMFGIEVPVTDLMQSHWEVNVVYITGLLILMSMLFYVGLVSAFSTRYHDESLAIRRFVDVLLLLKSDTCLQSESSKGKIRAALYWTAQQILKIQDMSRLPVTYAAPREMKAHLTNLSLQVERMTARVSIPDETTLPELREELKKWLAIFLKAEYGLLPAAQDLRPNPISWFTRVVHPIGHYWKRIAAVLAITALVLVFTKDQWIGFWPQILDWSWLALRFVILIVLTSMILNRWGPKAAPEQPEAKWQTAARLILFLFIPLIALDMLLSIGIMDRIFEFVGQLKPF